MPVKILSTLVLCGLLSLTALSQSGSKEPEKAGEPQWPDKIGEKTLQQWLKIAQFDKDASVREQAIQTLQRFEPKEVRKTCAAALIKRLDTGGEPDSFLKIALIDLVGSLGIEDKDEVKEAVRVISPYATDAQGSVNRLHALQALAKFGPRAYSVSGRLTQNEAIYRDPSFEVRRTLAKAFASIGASETTGPSLPVLNNLAKQLIRDPSLPVRLEALQTLYILGPPWDQDKLDTKPRAYDETKAAEIANIIKVRVRPGKATENKEENPQAEMWCHFVLMRFAKQEKSEFDEQLNGIAAHLNSDQAAVRFQCLEILGLMGDFAEPKKAKIIELLRDKEPLVKAAAALTLGKMGDKMGDAAFEQIMALAMDPNEETKVRLEALVAVSYLGEKAERARERIMEIVKDPANLKAASGVSILQQALLTLAAMGVKSKPILGNLVDLRQRVQKEKLERQNSAVWKLMFENPDFKKMWSKLSVEDQKKFLGNQAEDQLCEFIDKAIQYIQESAPGRPGPEHKK